VSWPEKNSSIYNKHKRERKKDKKMERVLSIAEITEQYWLTSKACKEGDTTKMNRSDSEWAFQKFLREQQAAEEAEAATAKPSSSSTSTSSSTVDVNLKINNSIDSEDYQALLKTKLDLACAAVAKSRVYISFSF
jgi:hypothetical protein